MNTLETVIAGMLGGLTFGIYHMIHTNKLIREHNELINKRLDEQIKKLIFENENPGSIGSNVSSKEKDEY